MTDRKLQLVPYIADCSASGAELVGASPGPGGSYVCALSLVGVPDYRETAASGVSFAKLKADRAQDFVIRQVGGDRLFELQIEDQAWNFHFSQPLPGGRWLLAGARCRRYADGSHDENGRVFAATGALEREFLLGDGVREIQTTTDGKIWTSYFDEGVFGNFGWVEPVGASGLVCWSERGEKLYEFSPAGLGAGLDSIVDCYALNVVSDREAWVCYYTDFPLVKITDHEISGVWEQPVGATHAFAVWRDWVLFQGGYDDAHRFFLCEFGRGETLVLRETIVFQDAHGADLPRAACAGRGPFLFLTLGRAVYRVDLRALTRA